MDWINERFEKSLIQEIELMNWYTNCSLCSSRHAFVTFKFMDKMTKSKCATIKMTAEKFSFECQKLIGFALHDWLKNLSPLFRPSRSRPKTNCDSLTHTFSHAFHQLHVLSLSFDWFTLMLCPMRFDSMITLVLVSRH